MVTEKPANVSPARLAQAIRVGVYAFLLWLPLPFGSVGERNVLLIHLVVGVLGTAAAVLVILDPVRLTKAGRIALGIAAIPLLVMVLQLLPWPPAIQQLLIPQLVTSRAEASELLGEPVVANSLSWSAVHGMHALLRWLSCIVIAFVAMVSFREVHQIKWFEKLFLLSVAFQAIYGMAEYLSGHQHIFGYQKTHYLGSATGTFINRNHFASYLALGIPFAIGLWMRTRLKKGRQNSWRTLILRGFSMEMFKRAVGFSTAGVLFAAILLSYSRGGLLAALVALATVLFLFWLRRPRALLPNKTRTMAVALLLLTPIFWISTLELKAPGERFVAGGTESILSLGQRFPAWKASTELIQDYWITGIGAGSFESAFQSVQTPNVYRYWNYLHNDWLQALVELGPIGFIALLWLAYWVMKHLLVGIFNPQDEAGSLKAMVFAALLGAAVHAVWDFSSKIPGIGITLALLCGLVFSRAFIDSTQQAAEESEGTP